MIRRTQSHSATRFSQGLFVPNTLVDFDIAVEALAQCVLQANGKTTTTLFLFVCWHSRFAFADT